MDVKTIIADVNNKFSSVEFQTRYTTINGDFGLYFMTTPYQVLASEGMNKGQPLPGMTFITGNQPQTWANHCMSILTSQEPKISVISRDANLFANGDNSELIKNWWETVFLLANKECKKKVILPINRSMAWDAVLTDCIIPRAIIDNSGDSPVYDIQIADTATVCWAKKKRGIKWIAYRFPRSKEEIQDEYPQVKMSEDERLETHWWGFVDGKVTEVIYIADEWVSTVDWSASMDSLPLSVNPILLNPDVRINNVRQSSGASVYWGARDAYKEQNRAKSVMATLLMREASPAIKHSSTTATGEPGSKLPFYPTDGSITDLLNAKEDIGNIFTNTPTALQAVNVYDNDSTKQAEQATAPEIAFGGQEYSHMPTSLWDRRAAQMGKVLFPRRDAMESAYENIFYAMFDQFCKMNIELQVKTEKGGVQKVTSADLAKLKDKFEVKFEVTSVEPTGDLMIFQKALAASQAGVDPNWIDEHVMDYDDLTEIREDRIKRQALALDPTLNLFDAYAIACKELDAMEPGMLKDMKTMEIKYRKANLEKLARMAVEENTNAKTNQ